MTRPRRRHPQSRPSGRYRPRGRPQTANWKRYGTEWMWVDLLWKGVTSACRAFWRLTTAAWFGLWRWAWRLQLWVVLPATLLVIGHWAGLLWVLPETFIVPLKASVCLYWGVAVSMGIVYWGARKARAQDGYVRTFILQEMGASGMHPGNDLSDSSSFPDLDNYDYDFGGFDGGGGDGD